MNKNKYIVGAVIAVVFFTIGYWASVPRGGPTTGFYNSSVVTGDENTTSTPSPETVSGPAVPNPKPVAPTTVIVARGRFNGSGSHTSWGTVTIERTGSVYTLRLGSDFLVTDGPDLFVYLGRSNQYEPGFKVGPLQKATGAQTYSLTASPKDTRYYDEVVIWNEPNSIPFAKAVLTVVQ